MYIYIHIYVYMYIYIYILYLSFGGHANFFFIGMQNMIWSSKSSFHSKILDICRNTTQRTVMKAIYVTFSLRNLCLPMQKRLYMW